MGRTLTRLALVAIIAWGAYHWWGDRPVTHGPGVVAPETPVQTSANTDTFTYRDYRITPLADFKAEARVLSKEHYRVGREADLSPVDLALGWGRMSDESVLQLISINQSNRFYYWRVDKFPIPRREIETHSANMHFIPANTALATKLKQIRQGNVVRLKGYLVRVDANDNWHWVSSLTRDDVGNGACELIWLEELDII